MILNNIAVQMTLIRNKQYKYNITRDEVKYTNLIHTICVYYINIMRL